MAQLSPTVPAPGPISPPAPVPPPKAATVGLRYPVVSEGAVTSGVIPGLLQSVSSAEGSQFFGTIVSTASLPGGRSARYTTGAPGADVSPTESTAQRASAANGRPPSPIASSARRHRGLPRPGSFNSAPLPIHEAQLLPVLSLASELNVENQQPPVDSGPPPSDTTPARFRPVTVDSSHFGSLDGLRDDDLCTICLRHFHTGNFFTRTECDHIFHADCFDGWIQNHDTCPLCRTVVKHPDESARRFTNFMLPSSPGIANLPLMVQYRNPARRASWKKYILPVMLTLVGLGFIAHACSMHFDSRTGPKLLFKNNSPVIPLTTAFGLLTSVFGIGAIYTTRKGVFARARLVLTVVVFVADLSFGIFFVYSAITASIDQFKFDGPEVCAFQTEHFCDICMDRDCPSLRLCNQRLYPTSCREQLETIARNMYLPGSILSSFVAALITVYLLYQILQP